jgi:hypothetical protein
MKILLIILSLLIPSVIASAAIKAVYTGEQNNTPANLDNLAQAASKQILVELKSRLEFDAVLPDSYHTAVQSNNVVLKGLDTNRFILAAAGLAGADYLLTANFSTNNNRFVIVLALVDVLSGLSQWNDSVYTTDLSSSDGVIKAVKAGFDRILLKAAGQSVAEYNERSASQEFAGYQVKLHISDITGRDENSRYRLEMLPVGEVAVNTNLIIPGKIQYTFLLYKDWINSTHTNNNDLVYSNSQYIDGDYTANLVDNKWGGFFDFRAFTGMGLLGIGSDYFFTRKLSCGLSVSGSFFLPEYQSGSYSLTFNPEVSYYFIGDRSYEFRLSAGIDGLYTMFNVNYGKGDSVTGSMAGIGIFTEAGYNIFFLRVMATYSFGVNYGKISYPNLNSFPIYPTIELGVRL